MLSEQSIPDYLNKQRAQGNNESRMPIPRVQVTEAAAGRAVDLDDLKLTMRIDGNDENTALNALLEACEQKVEGWCGRKLVNQSLTVWYDYPPLGPILELPYSPASAVGIVSTYAEDDTETTFSSDSYITDLIGNPPRLILRDGYSWPTSLRAANALTVAYTAGYGDTYEEVPAGIREALKLLVIHFYEGKDRQKDMKRFMSIEDAPNGVASLLSPHILTRFE